MLACRLVAGAPGAVGQPAQLPVLGRVADLRPDSRFRVVAAPPRRPPRRRAGAQAGSRRSGSSSQRGGAACPRACLGPCLGDGRTAGLQRVPGPVRQPGRAQVLGQPEEAYRRLWATRPGPRPGDRSRHPSRRHRWRPHAVPRHGHASSAWAWRCSHSWGCPSSTTAHHPSVVQIVGPVHGIFYILYLVASLDLAGRARFNLVQLLGMVCAGWVPLLAFYMERKVTQRVKGFIALGPDAPPGPAATLANLVAARTGRPGGGPGHLAEPRD